MNNFPRKFVFIPLFLFVGFIAPLCALAAADPVGFSSVLTERVIALFLVGSLISFLSIIILFFYYIRQCNVIIEQVISYNIRKLKMKIK
jgi:hypothetical protein